MISFSCDQCGKQFNLKPEFAGRTTACSGCKAPLVVPTPDATIGYDAPPAETVAPVVSEKIAFSCEHCGMKFSVRADCAGRKTNCPACKAAMVVPSPAHTVSYVPAAGQIAGAPSSLAKAGVNVTVTLGGDRNGARQTPLQDLLYGKATAGERYVIEREIARGGMGAVMRAIDCDIRREVAVKYLLDQSDNNKKVRFVEEAQITGQLEHPNIVPIHELGVDSQRRMFFTMKMVKGHSLADILKSLLMSPATTEVEYPLGRLLNIFVNICNALAYAHSRGVVHRDLKPANIMVGDFGEVYVMDWGLAKVLKTDAAIPLATLAIPLAIPAGPDDVAPPPLPVAARVSSGDSSTPPSSGRIMTSRELDTDLTQEGSVLGTPVYMPPEQAAGKINDIDERSDIYSMGAILYEMLTLQTPIRRDGGFAAVIQRVTQGEIVPPEKQAPERSRAGRIPPELAAIAMKALAKNRDDRYSTIELLRQDVERFIDGRSVSAKQDTIREMAAKLVRRNKGVSIATASAALVLTVVVLWSSIAIFLANSRALTEELAKREQGKRSVPTFVRVAKVMILDRQFDDAQTHLDTAINFDEADPEARFVRATLLLSKQEYAGALADLEVCQTKQPDRADAKKLVHIAQNAQVDHKATMLAVAEELTKQKAITLSQRVMENAEKLMTTRKEIADSYRKRLEAAYSLANVRVNLNDAGEIVVNIQNLKTADLTPLKGMKLTALAIDNSPQIKDLTALAGMPLVRFYATSCSNLGDLAPLQSSRLKTLSLNQCSVKDLSPLRGARLTHLFLDGCPELSDLSPLSSMELTEFVLSNCTSVTDLSPLRNMPLKKLNLQNSIKITDVSALGGMQLEELSLYSCPVSDLSPLKGMPLTMLNLKLCSKIVDLSPLRGMQLKQLNVESPLIKNLTDLEGMPLEALLLKNLQVTDLGPLREMKTLKYLEIIDCPKVQNLLPLRELKLTVLYSITRLKAKLCGW